MNRATLSASNLYAARLCPGKPRMEKGLADSSSADSDRGTRLHQYFLTGKSYDDLNPQDRELMESADRYAEEFLQQFLEMNGMDQSEPFVKEHEVPLHGIVPGHPDTIISWRGGDIVAVLDLKSGWGVVDEAPDNDQLADYALLVYARKQFKVCGVAIVQPNALGPRLTSAVYKWDQMVPLAMDIHAVKKATEVTDAPTIAGERQCGFCKAKAICQSYKDKFMGVQEYGERAISTLTNEELVRVKQAISFANKIESEVNDEMRKRISEDSLPGWKLRNTGTNRIVRDPIGMWESFKATFHMMHPMDYDACREIQWGKLEALIQKITGWKEKEAKRHIRELSAPYVEETEKAKAPVPEKPKK